MKYTFKMFPLFDLSLQLNGFPMKEAKAELRKIVAFSEKEHEVFIENKKKEIVNFHLQNNSFYQDLVGQQLSKTGMIYPF